MILSGFDPGFDPVQAFLDSFGISLPLLNVTHCCILNRVAQCGSEYGVPIR